MGDVVTLKPVAETLEFSGGAEQKVQRLICDMIKALHVHEQASHDRTKELAYEEIVRLQRELAVAQARVAFLEEVLDAANKERRTLWEKLPEGCEAMLLVHRDDNSFAATMTVERKVARINCSELCLYESASGTTVRVA